MTGRRKCAGCEHGKNISRSPDYYQEWRCKLPTGEEVCGFNKEKVKNFFTPRKVKP